MYRIVDEAECRPYRSYCSATLKKACSLLRAKGITAQFTLVGSGARNMVTRNGNGPFDLDYNLEILKLPEAYRNDLRKFKDIVRISLDEAMDLSCFSHSQDSTSCLTAILHFENEPTVKFKFDVAIVKRNSKGTLCRLIHNKMAHVQYIWNEVPDSYDVAKKARQLKAEGRWGEVRDRYVELKNKYLTGIGGGDHPSFIVYIEAVNQVYNKYFE